jgi:peptide deformylase
MPVVRQIALMGNPILRQQSAEIADAQDSVIHTLVEDMLATTLHSSGVGLAAPQVFEPLRLIILASRPNPRYPNAPEMTPTGLINPELLWASDERETGWEGCLSIPGMRGLVPRHRRIGVRYLTGDGAQMEYEYEGFPARIFQHELDHLNATLFPDRLESLHDLYTEQEYLRRLQDGR